MRPRIRLLPCVFFLLGILGTPSEAMAAVEEVYVQSVSGDSAVITRRDGIAYIIQKHSCPR